MRFSRLYFQLTGTTDFILVVRGEVNQVYSYDDEIPENNDCEEIGEFHVRCVTDRAYLSVFLVTEKDLTDRHYAKPIQKTRCDTSEIGYERDIVLNILYDTIQTILVYTGVKQNDMSKKFERIFKIEIRKRLSDEQIIGMYKKSRQESHDDPMDVKGFVMVTQKNLEDAKKFVEVLAKDPKAEFNQQHDSNKKCNCKDCRINQFAILYSKQNKKN
jgi:hypothetical protein